MEAYQQVYDDVMKTVNFPDGPISKRMTEVVFKLGFKQKFGDKYPSVEEFKKDLTEYASTFIVPGNCEI